MRIDRSHRPWAIASAAIMAVAVAGYVPYALDPVLPSGGSVPGLIYGTVGFACMVYVTLLSLRKKFPIWRIGRTQTWMRGHLWLGALTLPLIVLHAGFLFGHGLTAAMMAIFVVVYASGIFGAWLQHALPRRMMQDVPLETIYDEIGHVREQLLDEADTVVAEACGKLETSVSAQESAPGLPIGASTRGGSVALATVMRPVTADADDTGPLRDFYMKEMRPFVERPSRAHPLADAIAATSRFAALRLLLPPGLLSAVADLEQLCEEERQLLRQERLHRVLHGWLIVHAPLSFALMALAVVHVFMAVRF